jgi:hypothetical protein
VSIHNTGNEATAPLVNLDSAFVCMKLDTLDEWVNNIIDAFSQPYRGIVFSKHLGSIYTNGAERKLSEELPKKHKDYAHTHAPTRNSKIHWRRASTTRPYY